MKGREYQKQQAFPAKLRSGQNANEDATTKKKSVGSLDHCCAIMQMHGGRGNRRNK